MLSSSCPSNILWPAASHRLHLHLHSPSIICPGPVHLLPNCFSSWFLIIHSSPQALNTFSTKSVSCSKPSVFIITLRLESSPSHGPWCLSDPPLHLTISCLPCSLLQQLRPPFRSPNTLNLCLSRTSTFASLPLNTFSPRFSSGPVSNVNSLERSSWTSYQNLPSPISPLLFYTVFYFLIYLHFLATI